MSNDFPISACRPSITYRWQSSDTVSPRLCAKRSRKSFMSADPVKDMRSVFFPGSKPLYDAERSSEICLDIENYSLKKNSKFRNKEQGAHFSGGEINLTVFVRPLPCFLALMCLPSRQGIIAQAPILGRQLLSLSAWQVQAMAAGNYTPISLCSFSLCRLARQTRLGFYFLKRLLASWAHHNLFD